MYVHVAMYIPRLWDTVKLHIPELALSDSSSKHCIQQNAVGADSDNPMQSANNNLWQEHVYTHASKHQATGYTY